MTIPSEEVDALIAEVRQPGCDISEMAIRQLRPLLEELVLRRNVHKMREAMHA